MYNTHYESDPVMIVKRLFGLSVLLMMIMAAGAWAQSPNFTGMGTESEPYLIETAEDLVKLAELVNDVSNIRYTDHHYANAFYELTGNIDLEGAAFDPIGRFITTGWDNQATFWDNYIVEDERPFSGTFNGKGFKIEGLSIDGTAQSYAAALFSFVSDGGIVKNLRVEGEVLGNHLVGGIIGFVDRDVLIENCSFSGTVTGAGSPVGGLAGQIGINSTIRDSYTEGHISTTSGANVGGVVGGVFESDVIRCYSTAVVTSNNSTVGGIAGFIDVDNGQSRLEYCVALNPSLFSGTWNAGRIVGYVAPGQISTIGNAYFAGMQVTTAPIPSVDGTALTLTDLNTGNGTFGGRFPLNANGWTMAEGKLPGHGAAADMPAHLDSNACIDCLDPAVLAAQGVKLSDFETPFINPKNVHASQNAMGYFWYTFTDNGIGGSTEIIDGLQKNAQGDIILIVEINGGIVEHPDGTAILDVAGRGRNDGAAAFIEFNMGPTFQQVGSLWPVPPFAGIGVLLYNGITFTGYYNAADHGASGIYFEYKTDADFLTLEVADSLNRSFNDGDVFVRHLPGTNGAWRGVTVNFSDLARNPWGTRTEALNLNQLAHFSFRNRDQGAGGTFIALDNVYMIGTNDPFPNVRVTEAQVEYTASAGGMISVNSAAAVQSFSNDDVALGSVFNVAAIPDDDFCFVKWSDGVMTAIRVDEANNDISVTAEFSPCFVLDDFESGDGVLQFGRGWFLGQWGGNPATLPQITNAGPVDDHGYLTLVPAAPGRDGSGYCALMQYTNLRPAGTTIDDWGWVDLIASLTEDSDTPFGDGFKNVKSISFWAKGSTGGPVRLNLLTTKNSPNGIFGGDGVDTWNEYHVKFTPTEEWVQYTFSLENIVSVAVEGAPIIGAATGSAGDFKQQDGYGIAFTFKPEEVTALVWQILGYEVTQNSGSLYIDDITFNLYEPGFDPTPPQKFAYVPGPNGSIKVGNVVTKNEYPLWFNLPIEMGPVVEAVPDAGTGYRFVKWSDGVAAATRQDVDIIAEGTVTAEFEFKYALAPIFVLDDFESGGSVNKVGFEWSFGKNGVIPHTDPQIINAGPLYSSDPYIYTFVSTTEGCEGSNRCAALLYTDLRPGGLPMSVYDETNVILRTGLTANRDTPFGDGFKNVASISFRAKGTAGQPVRFRLLTTQNSPDGPYAPNNWNSYQVRFIPTAEWTKYTFSIENIVPVVVEGAPIIGPATGSAGDFVQDFGWGRAFTFKPEEIISMNWEIQANEAITNAGNLFIDDVVFYLHEENFEITTRNNKFVYSPGTGGSLKVGDFVTTSNYNMWLDDDTMGAEVEAIPLAGYRFVKWSDDVTTAIRQDEAADSTVTALFELITYTITFNLNGGSGILPDPISAILPDGVPAAGSKPSTENFTKTGHTHDDKWYSIAVSGSDTTWTEFVFGTAAVTDYVTLYLKWTINTYTVTFKILEDDEESFETVTVDHGDDADAPSTDPTRTGYTFDGWDTELDNVTEDLTVIAQWTIITYTVTFKVLADDEEPFETVTVDHGSAATAPSTDPTRTGYTFDGWDIEFVNVTGDLTVIAKWTLNTYIVTFKILAGDEESFETVTVDHGSAATAPSTNPTRTGYTFDGWDIEFDNVTGDLTVIAQWTLNTYTVTFVDGTGNEIDRQTIDHGNAATAPSTNPTRTGYTFDGWDIELDNVTGNLTVIAQWTINTYTVTFKILDGDEEAFETVTVDHGSAATAPSTNPTRAGFTFDGWDIELDNVTGNLTVIAKWIEDAIVNNQVLGSVAFLTPTQNESVDASPSSYLVTVQALDTRGVVFNGVIDIELTVVIGGLRDTTDIETDASNGMAEFRHVQASAVDGGRIMFIARAGSIADTAFLRIIPPPPQEQSAPPVLSKSSPIVNEFTAGPNPVFRVSYDHVKIFRNGAQIDNTTLTIYSASGSVVNRIKIDDRRGDPRGRPLSDDRPRHVGTWNLRDAKGRPAAPGTYLLRGTVTTADGKREKVSLIIGIK
ncbi:MAG: InlB B-repeat-containing protein [Chitinispirillia bacterium]|nr:InlB B-repeat-containing protein [Chitinispirillia bacterium]